MFNVFCEALSLLFIVGGIFFFIMLIFIKLITFDNKDGFCVVLKGTAQDDDLFAKIYAAYLEANMFNFVRVNRIVVLDYGVSSKVKEDCLSLFSNSDIVTFVNANDEDKLFLNVLENDEHNVF